MEKKLLRPKDVSGCYGFSASKIERLLRDPEAGFPKPILIGRNRYWRAEAIDEFVARHEEASEERRSSEDGEEGEAA